MGSSIVSLARFKHRLTTLMRAMKYMENPPLYVLLFILQQGAKGGTVITTQIAAVNSMDINEPGLKLKNVLLVLSTRN